MIRPLFFGRIRCTPLGQSMTPRKTGRTSTPRTAPGKHSPESAPAGTFPVVGIGASAGGLEAYTAFFRALQPDLGMAYVLVPHLDPARESAYAQILARVTSMPVLQVENGMPLRSDHVYVIPPNCDLAIVESRSVI